SAYQRGLADRERDLPRAGIAEAAGPHGDVVALGDTIDEALVDPASARVEEVERDRCPAARPRSRPVDLDRRAAVAMPERLELLEQPCAEAGDALVDRVDADALDVLQPDL